jgi:hypothetical protein
MAKKKSKLKRFLKKAAPLLAAGLGAAALGRRGRNLGVSGADKRAFTTDRAYTGGGYDDPIMTGGVGVKFNRRNMYSPNDFGLGPYDGAKKGGRAGKDFGKRGVGKAKRGFGKAMKKGGK